MSEVDGVFLKHFFAAISVIFVSFLAFVTESFVGISSSKGNGFFFTTFMYINLRGARRLRVEK